MSTMEATKMPHCLWVFQDKMPVTDRLLSAGASKPRRRPHPLPSRFRISKRRRGRPPASRVTLSTRARLYWRYI